MSTATFVANIILLLAFHLNWIEVQAYCLNQIYKINNQNLLPTLSSIDLTVKTYCLLFGMGPNPRICHAITILLLAFHFYCSCSIKLTVKTYCLHCSLLFGMGPKPRVCHCHFKLVSNIILLLAFNLNWIEVQTYCLNQIYKINNQNLLPTLSSINLTLKTYCLHCSLLFGMGPKQRVCNSITILLLAFHLNWIKSQPYRRSII